MKSMTQPLSPTLRSARGISSSDVDRVADALLREGVRPTVEKVRQQLGKGSPNTINPLLDAWWKRLASRLDSGPHALHRLPEPVAHITETLWLTALDEARARAGHEQRRRTGDLDRDRREVDLRRHLLSLREAELEDRLKERDRTISQQDEQLRGLMRLLQQEQASRAGAERRIAALRSSVKRAEARVQALLASLAVGTGPSVGRGRPEKLARTPAATRQTGALARRPARKSGARNARRSKRKGKG